MSPPPKLSRRTLTFGGIAAAGAAIVAGAVYGVPRIFKRRARGEYADLANRLDDTDQASAVGRQLLDQLGSGPSADTSALVDKAIREAAIDIRNQLKTKPLRDLYAADAAKGMLVEAGGWVMPARRSH